MSWEWVLLDSVLAIHARQIAEHGGAPGVRDLNLLHAALARPQHAADYGSPDAFDLAAAYAWGILRNHPFVDGNKRTAYVTARLFLRLNGVPITVPKIEAVLTVVAAAAGNLDEKGLSEKMRGWS